MGKGRAASRSSEALRVKRRNVREGSFWISVFRGKDDSPLDSVFSEKASFGWKLSDRNAYEGRTAGVALMRSAGPILNYLVIFQDNRVIDEVLK